MAEWGVPAYGGKARPPRVTVCGPKAKGEQDEPAKPRELDSPPDDEADRWKRDDIFRKIFS